MTMKRNELRNTLALIALAFGAATLPAQATNAGSAGSGASGSASSASDASSSGTNAAAAAAAPAGGTNSPGPSTATAGRDKESTSGTNAPAATGNNSAGRIAGTNMPPTAAAPTAPMNAADQQLVSSINSALAADDKLKDAQLRVYASNGNVTLSGTVKDQAQGDRAMQLAKSISGVKNVTPSLMITSR